VVAAAAALLSVRVNSQTADRATTVAGNTVGSTDGHIDPSGLYNPATVTLLERPDVFEGKATETETEAAKYAMDFVDGAISSDAIPIRGSMSMSEARTRTCLSTAGRARRASVERSRHCWWTS
jgi:hypothetical protein